MPYIMHSYVFGAVYPYRSVGGTAGESPDNICASGTDSHLAPARIALLAALLPA
jgi:hypothetical protein